MSNESGWPRKAGSALLWLLILFEVLTIGMAGFAKFGASSVWPGLFTEWGYPVWFTYVVGAGELGGAILLLVPRTSSYAAAPLLVIMMGALGTVLVTGSQLGPVTPLIHMGALTLILLARRDRRWKPAWHA
jgi:uncharacterized membrane protein YphA (DoxX/SURF4 family)